MQCLHASTWATWLQVLQVLGTLSVQSLWSCLIRLHSLCIEAELTSDTSALLPILKHTPRVGSMTLLMS
jgi:hypothetical protein